jgi:hypothetical protein
MNQSKKSERNERKEMTVEGYVLFLPFAVGSKSESIRPYVVDQKRNFYNIYMPEDNPFQNESIIAFHKNYCEVEGLLDEERMHIYVSSISIKEDPFKSE